MKNEIAKIVEDKLSRAGIKKASYHTSDSVTEELSVIDGEFSLYRTLYDNNLSVTVYKDGKKGSSSINKYDEASVDSLIAACIENADNSIADEAYQIAPDQGEHEFDQGCYECDREKLYERTKELADTIKKDFPNINLMELCVYHKKIDGFYKNTNGTSVVSKKGYYSVSIEYTAQQGEKTTSLAGSNFGTCTLDKPFIEMANVRKDLEDCVAQLGLKPFEGKFTGTVILTPDCVSNFIFMLQYNFAGNSVILSKTSMWLDKIGKQVASPKLTISFCPNDSRLISDGNLTSDGFLAKDFKFIEKGVLNSYLINLFTANKTGYKVAPNDSGCFVIEGGSKSLEDMIKGIKQGLIVSQFSGGEPGANGEFSGVAKGAFEIRDGKIAGAVNEVMINGNINDMFNNIADISSEAVNFGDYICPYISFDGIVVSGK